MRWMPRQLGLLLAAGWLAIAPASANESYTIHGHGVDSCGAWTEERRKDSWTGIVYSSWLGGYLTAFNRFRATDGHIAADTDMEGMLAWVDKFCLENPLDQISAAADVLVLRLISKRIVREIEAKRTAQEPAPDFSQQADPLNQFDTGLFDDLIPPPPPGFVIEE